MDLLFDLCTCTAKHCVMVSKCNYMYMYMSVSMLINSLFLVATPCLAVIFLTMHMKGEKGRGRLLKVSATCRYCIIIMMRSLQMAGVDLIFVLPYPSMM